MYSRKWDYFTLFGKSRTESVEGKVYYLFSYDNRKQTVPETAAAPRYLTKKKLACEPAFCSPLSGSADSSGVKDDGLEFPRP